MAIVTELPQVFVGSSKEGLELARRISRGLVRTARLAPWDDAFLLGDMTLHRLVELAAQVDFANLVLTPDDLVTKRGRQRRSPRDNMIFEAGLFMGRLGPERTLLVHSDALRRALPSDLD